MAIEKAKVKEKDEAFLLNIFELNLQRAVQACIDMANVVIAKEGLGLPNQYRQSFELLAKNSIIGDDLLKIMVSMVGFRNISVHDYSEVKPEVVKAIVDKHLVDFEKFYSTIFNYTNSSWK